MNELQQKIEKLTEVLYQNREEDGYAMFIEIFPEIQQFAQAQMRGNVQKLLVFLKRSLEAYEHKDIIALADVMKYEVMEWMNEENNGYLES